MKKVLLALSVFLLLAVATATTIVPMSVENLTDVSTDIVEAQAIKSWSEWNAQQTMIVTYTQFSVESRLKGSAASSITVKQPGGSAGEYTQHVAGVRPWSAGESAVLFLRPSSSRDGTFTVSGLMQGNFRVRRSASGEAVADNGVESAGAQAGEEVQSYSPSSGSVSSYTGSRMKLNDLERRVLTSVRAR